MVDVDREVRAMRDVAKALQGLSDPQRARVLAWALNRWGGVLGRDGWPEDELEGAE
jgi:hypothetical protein